MVLTRSTLMNFTEFWAFLYIMPQATSTVFSFIKLYTTLTTHQ